jgi:hypothetical protein
MRRHCRTLPMDDSMGVHGANVPCIRAGRGGVSPPFKYQSGFTSIIIDVASRASHHAANSELGDNPKQFGLGKRKR